MISSMRSEIDTLKAKVTDLEIQPVRVPPPQQIEGETP